MFKENNFSFRKIELIDEKLILNWSNDELVRRWSFNSELIKENEHHTWFKNKYNDNKILMWIFEVSNEPSGLVRFEKKEKKAILNYLISPSHRGRGLAVHMLSMSLNKIHENWGEINIFAFTFPENIASKKSLEKAGFCLYESNKDKLCFIFKNYNKILSSQKI